MADRIVFAFDRKTARSKDADGRMRVKDCVLSTAEINPYRGQEIPHYSRLGLDPNKVYELFRDPDELERAAPTFEGVPLMIKHIPQTAEDPKKEYIGGSVHSITFDGKHLRGDLLVMDGYAIDLIESDTLSDLSCGYRYDPVMQAGTRNGSKYDGVMRNIQGNHVALVDDGRASGAHVADHALFSPQGPDPSMQGDSNMALPENNAPAAPAPAAPAAHPAGEAGAAPAPAAGAAPAPGAPPAAGGGDQVNMAAIGQALKHIAGLLEQVLSAQGGGSADTSAAPPPQEGGEEMEQTADTAGADEGEEMEGAEDFSLELGAQNAGAAAGEANDGDLNVGQGDYPVPKQAGQEGTTARGNPTPTGAMDSRSVRALVAQGVKQERARANAVAIAQREVRGVLGDVYGMDSAASIYREALAHVGVDVAQLPKGSESAAWQAYKVAAAAAAGVRPASEHAMDSKAVEAAQNGILGHLSRISVKG